MGCFPACFRNRRRKITAFSKYQCCGKNQSLLPSHEVNEAKVKLIEAATKSVTAVQIVNPVSETELKSELQPQSIGGVTDVSVVKKHVDTVPRKEACIVNDNLVLENEIDEIEKKCKKRRDEGSNCDLPSLEAHHSHQGLLISDKESVDVNSKNITSDGFKPICGTEGCVEPEESSESLFSLSIDSRRQVYVTKVEVGEKEVMSPFKPSSDTQTVAISSNSVDKRNPVIKCEEDKENVNVNSSRIKCECDQFKSVDNGIAADTSLSSWLVESHKSTKKVDDSPGSEKNYENRQMLEEIIPLKLKQLNGDTSSSLSIPSCAADSQPSVGTVDSYWLRLGQANS